MTLALPNFIQRENMGASPVAIKQTGFVLDDIDNVSPKLRHMFLAMNIDAAIRRSGAPEMFEALTKAEAFISGFEGDEVQAGVSELLETIRLALIKATDTNA